MDLLKGTPEYFSEKKSGGNLGQIPAGILTRYFERISRGNFQKFHLKRWRIFLKESFKEFVEKFSQEFLETILKKKYLSEKSYIISVYEFL